MPRLRSMLGIALGTAVYAFGLHYFVISNELMEGGVTGIALLLHYAANLPPSLTNLVLNVPLFALGWRSFSREQMAYTVLGTILLSFFLWMMETLIHLGWVTPFRTTQDYFLATLYAGVTLGAGLGLVLRSGGTTGGSDIIARYGQLRKGWSMGRTILAIDVAVIGASLLYIPKEKVLYTLVAVFIASRVIDFMTEGAYAARAFTIISEQGDRLATEITREIDRGVTLVGAKGAYSGQSKHIVYCVVARSEMRRLQLLVKQLDPHAFIVISDVHDVLGEGFRTDAD